MEKIQIVLASPSDLKEERVMIKDLVDSLNTVYNKMDLHFDLRMWENTVPGTSDIGPQGVVDADLAIGDADIFLCLYWKRVGTVIPDEGVAGTEHELNSAIASFRKKKTPDIKVFFKDTSDCEETDDVRHIKGIAERIKDLVLYTIFKSTDELKDEINKVLQEAATTRLARPISVDPKTDHIKKVSSSVELLSNIQSGNTIILEKGFYDILVKTDNPNIQYSEVYDGEEIAIQNINNLIIMGNESGLLTRPRYATVLTIQNCENIKLSGLILGHVPDKGYCSGAVLKLQNCKNIQIDSTALFGSGTYGLMLSNCENVIVNGSAIYECTYGGIVVENSMLIFKNSTIYDCKDLVSSLIEVTDGNVRMDNVSIHDCSSQRYMAEVNSREGKYSYLFLEGVVVFQSAFYDYSNYQHMGKTVFFWENTLTKYVSETT